MDGPPLARMVRMRMLMAVAKVRLIRMRFLPALGPPVKRAVTTRVRHDGLLRRADMAQPVNIEKIVLFEPAGIAHTGDVKAEIARESFDRLIP